MENKDVALVLGEIGDLLEILGENPFKIRAYQNGARIVSGLSRKVADLVASGELRKIKGIGEGLAEKIREMVETGSCHYREELVKSLPAGLPDLLKIPGLGPKRAKILYEKLGLKSVAELEYACQENRLLALAGFGEKSQANILHAIQHYNRNKGYFLVSDARAESEKFVACLKKQKGISHIGVAGSLRRQNDIVHDIDILAATKSPDKIHEVFVLYREVERVLARGKTKSSVVLKSGIQVDLRTVTDEEFPYALYYFTGSKEHNVAMRTIAKREGLKISEYGIFTVKRSGGSSGRPAGQSGKPVRCKTEADIFKLFGLDYIPPELRENMGEIEAARAGKLPELVERKDIRGTFHAHSSYSDGTAELEEMVRAAIDLGYEYIGISDHSESAFYAGGLKPADLARQKKEIDRLQKKYGRIKIFRGIESDISGAGGLDYSDQILGEFDFVIGAIHSRFNMPEKEMTRRICRAMAHPAMTFLAHPTGRLLLGREGYAIDYEAIFECAKKNRVVIEINANPHRLDLDWRVMRRAKELGILMSVNPDAHNAAGLRDVEYGVGVARKGWLEKKDVLNTRPAAEVGKLLQK